MIKLDIVPCPKPRMTQSDKWRSRPCTDRYWQFKDNLAMLWGNRVLPNTFWIVFAMPMPSSWGEKKKSLMEGKPHQSKPDCDNLLKAFMDCSLEQDCVIWDVRSTKIWSREGSIEIRELT